MMGLETPTSANNWTTSQLRLIEWLATPKLERKPKTQKQLAAEIGTDESTLSDWKKKPGLMDEVRGIARLFFRDRLPAIYDALGAKAEEGDVPAIKLVMEMTGEYTPKQAVDLNANLRWEDIVKPDGSSTDPYA